LQKPSTEGKREGDEKRKSGARSEILKDKGSGLDNLQVSVQWVQEGALWSFLLDRELRFSYIQPTPRGSYHSFSQDELISKNNCGIPRRQLFVGIPHPKRRKIR
jgi:hypothetical protein